MKNMGDYHDHYLKKDVLSLADVFEKFINTCLKCNGLDPCHYFSSALLKDMQKPITNTQKIMILKNRQNV